MNVLFYFLIYFSCTERADCRVIVVMIKKKSNLDKSKKKSLILKKGFLEIFRELGGPSPRKPLLFAATDMHAYIYIVTHGHWEPRGPGLPGCCTGGTTITRARSPRAHLCPRVRVAGARKSKTVTSLVFLTPSRASLT